MPMLLPDLEEDARGDGGALKARRNELYERMEHLTRTALKMTDQPAPPRAK